MTLKYLCYLVVDFTARSPEAALVLQVYWLWHLWVHSHKPHYHCADAEGAAKALHVQWYTAVASPG